VDWMSQDVEYQGGHASGEDREARRQEDPAAQVSSGVSDGSRALEGACRRYAVTRFAFPTISRKAAPSLL
jgi:hypothetical protein